MSVQALMLLVGSLAMLFATNWRFTLTVMAILPLALILFMVFWQNYHSHSLALVQRKLSALNTVLQENLAGMKVVQAFAREADQQSRFKRAADELMDQQIKVARVFTFLFPLIFLIANLGQAAVLYWGGKQIIDGLLTLGEWQKFSLYLVYVFFPIGQLGFIISQMSQAGASANRIFEIIDAKNDVVDQPGAHFIARGQGAG